MPEHILESPAVQLELLRRDVKALTEAITVMKTEHGAQIKALQEQVNALQTTWATTSNLAKILTWIVGLAGGIVGVWVAVKPPH